MIQIAAAFAMGCFGLGLLANLWLALRSSSMIDRILAVDTMTINVIALIVLYGIHTGSGMNFEAALLFAMTGFLGTVVYCKYLLRGDIIE